jgi:hypothetical protein
MNSTQESKLNMYHAVVNHGDANAATLATVPAFLTAFNAFKSVFSSISSTAQLEAQVLSGITLDKAQLRQNLCQQAADMGSVIFAYAASVSNNQLQQQVNFSARELLRLKDDLLAPTCLNICDAAQTNLAALLPYGITAATVTALTNAIDAYTTAVPSPRNAVSQRAAYKASIALLFKQADAIIKNQLDKLSVQFKTAHPQFLKEYKNNRVIIDAPSSATQIKGTVTNGSQQTPVFGAAVELLGKAVTVTTNTRGNYSIKSIEPGNYQVKISKQGYQDFTSPVIEVKQGKATKLNATLTT